MDDANGFVLDVHGVNYTPLERLSLAREAYLVLSSFPNDIARPVGINDNGGPPWGDSKIWREQSPSTYAGDFQTPMLLTIGEKDVSKVEIVNHFEDQGAVFERGE